MHRELGPELLETVYEVVLARELTERGLKVVRQAPVPITYKGIPFDVGLMSPRECSGQPDGERRAAWRTTRRCVRRRRWRRRPTPAR
ncbi:MAG: GxxExxY protein [Lentisphaerae bacterium]|nr:GxxExxY protein [Lentisphaerota bacterium]